MADQAPAEVLDLAGGTRRALAASCASVVSSPWLIRTLRPRRALTSLCSWLPGTAQRVAGGDHAHGQAQHAGGVGSAVDEVAEEHRPAALRVGGVDRTSVLVAAQRVAELDRAAARAPRGSRARRRRRRTARGRRAGRCTPLEGDGRGLDLLDAVERRAPCGSPRGASPRSPRRRSARCRRITPALRSRSGRAALRSTRDALRHVEHDRDRQDVVVAGELHERRAVLALDAGRVDDGEPAGAQPDRGDVVQDVEGRRGRRLVVLVVGDQTAADVAGQHLRRPEVPAREGALAAAGDADQHDQRQVRDGEHGRAVVPGHAASPLLGVRATSRLPAAAGPGEDGHLRRRTDLGVVDADRQQADGVAVRASRRGAPTRRTRARVHSNRWSRWRSAPAGRSG